MSQSRDRLFVVWRSAMRNGLGQTQKIHKERILRYFTAAAITIVVASSKVDESAVTVGHDVLVPFSLTAIKYRQN